MHPCSRCGHPKPDSEFHRDVRGRKRNYRSICRDCRKGERIGPRCKFCLRVTCAKSGICPKCLKAIGWRWCKECVAPLFLSEFRGTSAVCRKHKKRNSSERMVAFLVSRNTKPHQSPDGVR